MDLITKQQHIENILDKYNDIIRDESKRLNSEFAINSSEENLKAIKQLEEENRLLQIGIVGRVKAGKSSLLNALFFDGKSILPKAATPMTAALTVISYGDKLSAKVDFFTNKDIENIKNKYNEYKSENARLTEQFKEELIARKRVRLAKLSEKELKDKAIKRATRELKNRVDLVSAFEQYQKIMDSGITSIDQLKKEVKFEATSFLELTNKLADYVGADGKYMPFTKSVHIKLPDEKLKDIQIVDTPGVNDPVQSREKRTRELLKYCDVVLVVSPSGQFLSNEDTDLMDRITSKEGVRELFVVASQVDNQLSGSIKRDSNGNLHIAIDLVRNQLAEHMHSSLSKLKEFSPEIGNTYDQLIESSKEKVIHSAGICQTIISFWDKRDEWETDTLHAWKNLVKHYPDYFSDNDKQLSITNLEKLSNTSEVNNIINDVRKQKDTILANRKEEFINTKMNSLQKYKNSLLDYIEKRLEEINSSDVKELKKKRNEIKKIKTKASVFLDEEYDLQVGSLKIELKNTLTKNLNSFFNDAKKDIVNAEDSETETWTTGWWLWKKYHSRTYTTVRTGAVRSTIEELTSNIEKTIDMKSEDYISSWRRKVPQKLISTIRSHVDDEYLETYKIIQALSKVFNQIEYPELTYSGELPNNLSARGKLESYEAEEFIESAKNYVSSLKTRVEKDIHSFSKKMETALKRINLSGEFFSNYDSILKELEGQIENKEVTIDKFYRLRKELKGDL